MCIVDKMRVKVIHWTYKSVGEINDICLMTIFVISYVTRDRVIVLNDVIIASSKVEAIDSISENLLHIMSITTR